MSADPISLPVGICCSICGNAILERDMMVHGYLISHANCWRASAIEAVAKLLESHSAPALLKLPPLVSGGGGGAP